MTRATLGEQVPPAVEAVLEGETALSYDEIYRRLPEHIQTGRPTKKAVVAAIKAAGWLPWRRGDDVLYRAPGLASDPLTRRGEGDNIAGEQLRLLIERVERLIEEKQGIADDIKDVFAEAKAVGFDVKTIRTVIKLRGMEKHHRDEAEAMLETYLTALGMA